MKDQRENQITNYHETTPRSPSMTWPRDEIMFHRGSGDRVRLLENSKLQLIISSQYLNNKSPRDGGSFFFLSVKMEIIREGWGDRDDYEDHHPLSWVPYPFASVQSPRVIRSTG